MVRRVTQNPDWVPPLTRGDIHWRASRTWQHLQKSTDFIPLTKLTFGRTGANLRLDGSEGALIESQLQEYWLDERVCDGRGAPTWRADLCAEKDDDGPQHVYELTETLENPHSCPHRERSQGQGREIEDDVIELSPDLLEKYKVARGPVKIPANAQESALGGEDTRASAAAELLRSRIDRASDRQWDMEFMACAKDLVSSPRAERQKKPCHEAEETIGQLEGGSQGSSSGSPCR